MSRFLVNPVTSRFQVDVHNRFVVGHSGTADQSASCVCSCIHNNPSSESGSSGVFCCEHCDRTFWADNDCCHYPYHVDPITGAIFGEGTAGFQIIMRDAFGDVVWHVECQDIPPRTCGFWADEFHLAPDAGLNRPSGRFRQLNVTPTIDLPFYGYVEGGTLKDGVHGPPNPPPNGCQAGLLCGGFTEPPLDGGLGTYFSAEERVYFCMTPQPGTGTCPDCTNPLTGLGQTTGGGHCYLAVAEGWGPQHNTVFENFPGAQVKYHVMIFITGTGNACGDDSSGSFSDISSGTSPSGGSSGSGGSCCYSTPPGGTCGTLPATVQVDLSALSLCSKLSVTDGCTKTCSPGVVTLSLSATHNTCAGAVYDAFVPSSNTAGNCLYVELEWNNPENEAQDPASNWVLTVYDIRCAQSSEMWNGFRVPVVGESGVDSPPCGTYRLQCNSGCNDANNRVCTLTVTGACSSSTCTDCTDVTITFPATRTIVISGCPTTAWNGTWLLDNCASPQGCGYRQGSEPIAAVGSFFLGYGDSGGISGTGCGATGTGAPTDSWWVLSDVPGTNPNLPMTGGDKCDPVGATLTLGDGTTITVIA